MAQFYYSIDRKELTKYRCFYQRSASLLESQEYLTRKFDVFISHSYKDRDIVGNFVEFLRRDYGVSCFIDWKEDNRNPDEAANKLKKVMKNCKAMLLLRSENSDNSYWVPWETGCFETIKDGIAGNGTKYIALFPIANQEKQITANTVLDNTFKHMEFLKRYTKTESRGNLCKFLESCGIIVNKYL